MSLRALLGLIALGVVTLVATVVTSIFLWQASVTASRTRTALCQVLLAVRRESLAPRDPPISEAQIDRISRFYDELIGLVEDCHVPVTER